MSLAVNHPEQAARLLGVSDRMLQRMEMVRYPIYQPEYEKCRAKTAEALGEEAFRRAYAEGQKIAGEADPVPAILAMNMVENSAV